MGWIKPAAIRLSGSATWDATAPACQPAEDLPPGRPEQRGATHPALRDERELAPSSRQRRVLLAHQFGAP
jgi:hypothetical protein